MPVRVHLISCKIFAKKKKMYFTIHVECTSHQLNCMLFSCVQSCCHRHVMLPKHRQTCFSDTSRLWDVFVHRVSVASTVITEQMCVKANPAFPVWNASDKKKQTSSHVDSALLRLFTRTNKDTSVLKMVSSYLKGTFSIFISLFLLLQLQMQLIQ